MALVLVLTHENGFGIGSGGTGYARRLYVHIQKPMCCGSKYSGLKCNWVFLFARELIQLLYVEFYLVRVLQNFFFGLFIKLTPKKWLGVENGPLNDKNYNSGRWPTWRTISSIICLFESSIYFEATNTKWLYQKLYYPLGY